MANPASKARGTVAAQRSGPNSAKSAKSPNGRKPAAVLSRAAVKAPARRRGGVAVAKPGNGAAHDAGAAFRASMAETLSNLDAIEEEIAALVRSTIVNTLGAGEVIGKALMAVVRDVVEGALTASEQAGSDLVLSIRGVAKGVVRGVHDVRGDVAKAAAETVKTVIKHAHKVGADVGVVTRRAMDGIGQAVAETGENAGEVSRTAVQGATFAANKLGSIVLRTVREVLVGLSAGLDRVIAEVPVPLLVAPAVGVGKKRASPKPRASRA